MVSRTAPHNRGEATRCETRALHLPIIPDRLRRAAEARLFRQCDLLRCLWLPMDNAVAAVVLPDEEFRSRAATEIAVDAGVIDVIGARYVFGILQLFFSHTSAGYAA